MWQWVSKAPGWAERSVPNIESFCTCSWWGWGLGLSAVRMTLRMPPHSLRKAEACNPWWKGSRLLLLIKIFSTHQSMQPLLARGWSDQSLFWSSILACNGCLHKVAFMNPWLKDKPQSFTQKHMQHAVSRNVASGGGGAWSQWLPNWFPNWISNWISNWFLAFLNHHSCIEFWSEKPWVF